MLRGREPLAFCANNSRRPGEGRRCENLEGVNQIIQLQEIDKQRYCQLLL